MHFTSVRDRVIRDTQTIVQLDREIAKQLPTSCVAKPSLPPCSRGCLLPVPQTSVAPKNHGVYCSVEGQRTLSGLLQNIAEAAPELEALHVEIVYESAEITCFYIIAQKRDAQDVGGPLRTIGFARPVSRLAQMPEEKREQLEERIAAANEKNCQAEDRH